MTLTTKVLLGMGLGIVAGLAINLSGLYTPGSFTEVWIVNGLFHIVGTLFVNALKMMVVPLVLFSLICGVCGIGDVRLLGRIGSKAFVLYMLTTAVAIATGILIAVASGIGTGMEAASDAKFSGKAAPPLADVLLSIIPTNPVAALAQGDMLAIIFFAILFGISVLMVGEKAKPLVDLAELLNEAMMKMVSLIMALAPYAVFCLIGKAVSSLGLGLLAQLAGYVAVLIAVLLFHLFVTLQLTLKIFSGLSPRLFMRKVRDAQVFAFSTSSSNATIPVMLRTVTERLGVNNSVASFTVPFGATINMDGTAIMQGVATVFIANIYGVDLGLSGSVLASIGTAGVPGVGLIMLSMVFAQVGLPIEGIGLILGVDRLLDMIRTTVNVTGDAVVSCVVAKSEGKMDLAVYKNAEAGMAGSSVTFDPAAEAALAREIELTHAAR